MFNGIKNFFRKVGAMMGLIDKINEVTDFKNVPVKNEYYLTIDMWNELYKGHYKDIHECQIYSLDGPIDYTMLSLKMPKVASQKLATLIFNERCEVSVSSGDSEKDPFKDFILDTLKANKFYSNFQNQLEFMFARGGLVIKPFPKKNKNGTISLELSYVQAQNFYPISWDNTRVTEAVFSSPVYKDGKEYIHLEWHLLDEKGYVIRNQTFSAYNNSLESEVPLYTVFEDMEKELFFPGIDRPLFTYIKPNIANNLDSDNPLGISVFANSIDTLTAIDKYYDGLYQEMELGKKRIMVNTHAMHNQYMSDGTIKSTFNTKDSVYESVGVGSMDDAYVKEIDMSLRTQEIIDGLNANLNVLSMQLGFSPGTFTFDQAAGLKTATEVISEKSETFQTKKSHENEIEAGIIDMIVVLSILGQCYKIISKIPEYEVTVTFDDSIIQDRKTDIEEQVLLLTNQLQSKKNALMAIHGLTEEEAQQMLEEIRKESLASEPEYNAVKSEVSLFGNRE